MKRNSDTIYDELIKVRTEIAHKLGFENYVAFADVQMNRWDYDRKMIETYRKEILEKSCPNHSKSCMPAKQKRNQLSKATFADLPLVYPNGNATPKGTANGVVEKARTMYHELSQETGEFFDFMVDHELLDLLSKKASNLGVTVPLSRNINLLFIFANFNGTAADVDVLTHEAGHAFQAFQSRWIKEPEILFKFRGLVRFIPCQWNLSLGLGWMLF